MLFAFSLPLIACMVNGPEKITVNMTPRMRIRAAGHVAPTFFRTDLFNLISTSSLYNGSGLTTASFYQTALRLDIL